MSCSMPLRLRSEQHLFATFLEKRSERAMAKRPFFSIVRLQTRVREASQHKTALRRLSLSHDTVTRRVSACVARDNIIRCHRPLRAQTVVTVPSRDA